MPIGSVGFEHEDAGAEHDGHIRDIENSSPHWANPDVHEVDHHSVSDPIHEVGGATGDEQSHSKKSPSGPAIPHGDYGQGTKSTPFPTPKTAVRTGSGQSAPKAQEGTRVFDVLKTKRIGEE